MIISQAHAQTQKWTDISPACVNDGVATIQGIGCVLANILSVFLTVLGLAGLVMVIYAAFNLLLSGGNSQAMVKSKNTLTFAVVGIVLALSAFIIINLISNFTGIDIITNFSIPGSSTNY
jgi:phage shock protein PspC (stress-responsive transcriptional regulator)